MVDDIGNSDRPLRMAPPRRAGGGGGGGAMGHGLSLFQMSSTISHFPFCCIQCTMYLPEATAGVPGGSFAPAGKVQSQRPRSMAMSPAPCTASERSVRVGRGSIVLIVAKNALTASLPFIVAMFGGMITASAA